MYTQHYVCRCTCGESALTARIDAGQLIVEFPCSVCGQRHKTSVPLSKALSGGPFALRCEITDIAACYTGLPERLTYMDSLQSDEEIAAFIEHLIGIQPQKTSKGEKQTISLAADALCAAQNLAARDRISCSCGSLRFTAAYDEGVLRISCAICGASKLFPAKSIDDLAKILNCDMLTL